MVSMIAKRKFGTAISALGITTATLVGFAGVALADGPRDHRRPAFGGHRGGYTAPAPRFAHGGEQHRHGGHGGAVALGIGALFLGAVLAAEANRRHADRDYE